MTGNQRDSTKRTTLNSLAVVDALLDLESATFPEVADAVGLANSTTYAHLETLRSKDYVVKEGERYRLGFQFLHVGGWLASSRPYYRLIKAKVGDLAELTGERAQFIVEENGRGIYLITDAESPTAVQTDVYVGKWASLHTTAAGKSILGSLPRERVEEIVDGESFESMTPNTITSREALFDELDTVAERGYALNRGERIERQWAIGVPVLGQQGAVVGGLSISGPENRMKGERLREELPSQLLGVANEIELNLIHQ